MKQLFKLAQNTKDEKMSIRYYEAASALQWAIKDVDWNIVTILQEIENFYYKNKTLN